MSPSHRRRIWQLIGLSCIVAMSSCTQQARAHRPGPARTAIPAPTRAVDAAPTAAPAAPPAPSSRPARDVAERALADGFDLAAYHADPAAYVRIVDGSRCRQVAQPAAGTPSLQSVGAGAMSVPAGGIVRMQAQTDPGMPVSFTSQGLGAFTASGQSAVTVQADAAGIATAAFEATAGTVGHCLIIAGSPVRAGTVSYLITIQE